jgi:hypothetical protein
MGTIFIFVGPSLRNESIPHHMQAVLLPPASRGDLLKTLSLRPQTILVIDTAFHSGPQPTLGEIRAVIEAGVRVIGAGRQGALRAADLQEFCMEGRGQIYDMYRSGQLRDEDEVAVHYELQGQNYHVLSESLVNIRINLQQALKEKVISNETERVLLGIAKDSYYRERTYAHVFKQAVTAGISRQELVRCQEFIKLNAVDVCLQDAREALQYIMKTQGRSQVKPIRRPPLVKTLFHHRLELDHTGRWMEARFVSDKDVLHTMRLLDRKAHEFHRQILIRCLIAEKASRQKVFIPSDVELMLQFQTEHGLPTLTQVTDWLRERNMERAELMCFLREQALISSYYQRAGAFTCAEKIECETKIMQDFALDAGVLKDGHTDRVNFGGALITCDMLGVDCLEGILMAWVRIKPRLSLDPPSIRYLKYLGGFNDYLTQLVSVMEFNDGLLQSTPELRLELLEPQEIRAFFATVWGVTQDQFEWAMRLRGFISVRSFDNSAKTHYIFQKFVHSAMKNHERKGEETQHQTSLNIE